MRRFPYREVIGLASAGFAPERIAAICGCESSKVAEVVGKCLDAGLNFESTIKFTDEELCSLLDPPPPSSWYLPDFEAIFKTVNGGKALRRGVSKAHVSKAWQVYLTMGQKTGLPLCSREDFLKAYSKWCKKYAGGPDLRMNWTPAEEIQVDWAGKTVPIHGEGGAVTPAYIFVATLPYSSYTFARASVDMGMQSWLEHHRHMFEFFGGAPIFLVPDNLATAVDKAPKVSAAGKRHGRAVNAQYRELADYYGSTVRPTRFMSPKDKAAVERSVNFFVNKNLGFLRSRKCCSIDELNREIAKLLDEFNEKISSRFGCSRRELFQQEEARFLTPLPEKPFTAVTWERCKARFDATVCIRGTRYDIPEKYANRKLRARVTYDSVDIFASGRQRQMIAHHDRRPDATDTLEGFAGLRSGLHQPLDEWAAQNHRGEMIDQWHPTKNEGLTPHHLVCHSVKKVWWRCPDCGYEWQETPLARTSRSWDSCLACANVDLVPGKNDLATLIPDIAAEWHPERNLCGPREVFPSAQASVWWVGSDCGHEWRAPIADRVKSEVGNLCPYCSGKKALFGFNDVATLLPELAKLWHPANRVRKPENTPVTYAGRVILRDPLSDAVWTEPPKLWAIRHGYQEVVVPFQLLLDKAKAIDKNGRREEPGINLVDNDKAQTKATRSSLKWNASLKEWCWQRSDHQLLDEWHPERNGDLLPDDVSVGGDREIWWRCAHGHEWKASVRNRSILNLGCPYCSNRKVLPGFNDLLSLRPDLAAEWHPVLNLPLKPVDIAPGSHKKVWWRCSHGHEWETEVNHRAKGSGCPYCSGRKVLAGFNDLATTRPDLAAEWHPGRNGGLMPKSVVLGSHKKVWWRCSHGHEWETQVFHRAKGSGCPYCSGRKVLAGFNDLATTRPDLAVEWHPGRNGALTPADVTEKSEKKVWWRCARGHEWEAQIKIRVRDSSCPDCVEKEIFCRKGDLATERPDLAAEWHPGRNGALTPADVTAGSGKKVWWRCAHGHEWEARVCNRSAGNGCPYCSGRKVLAGFNDLATTRPDLAAEWHPGRNGALTPADVTAGSGKKVWWRCSHGHEWEVRVCDRDAGNGCPNCARDETQQQPEWKAPHSSLLFEWYPEKNESASNRVAAMEFLWSEPTPGSLASVFPDLAAEWHPERNGCLKPDFVKAKSGRKVWWRCAHGHEWEARVFDRAKGSGCPYCSGRKVLAGFNDLATTRPDLAAEWHPGRNGALTPADVTAGSYKKVWWRCAHGHEWETWVFNRAKGSGCPYCGRRKVLAGFNDLATTRPDLAAEWHPGRNGALTPADVVAGSGKKVWWLGECGHEWETRISHRNSGHGCPYCSGRKVLPGSKARHKGGAK